MSLHRDNGNSQEASRVQDQAAEASQAEGGEEDRVSGG